MPDPLASNTIRAFVAIPLSRELKERVSVLQARLQAKLTSPSPQAAAPTPTSSEVPRFEARVRRDNFLVRWTSAEQLHLTLRFFGDVPETDLPELCDALHQAVAQLGPFQLRINGAGGFPSTRRPTVVWLGLEGDLEQLGRLQLQIEQQTAPFGSHSESRAFHPHLTIARVKPLGRTTIQVGRALESEQVGELGVLAVDAVELVRSQLSPAGSIYSVLERVLL